MFKANITFGSVSSGTTSKGVPYKKSRAQVTTSKGTVERTVMAFGAQLETVGSNFRKGRSIDLTVAYQGGTVKVIGLPRAAAPAAAEG